METSIRILIKGLVSGYEVEHLARIFIPFTPLAETNSTRGEIIYARAGKHKIVVALRLHGKLHLLKKEIESETPLKLQVSHLLFSLFLQAGYSSPPWGMLTGVRPVHLLRRKIATMGKENAIEYFARTYQVTDTKIKLIENVVNKQQPILDGSGKKSYSLYVSIPFCPTRCSYCSFISRNIQRDAGLVDEYLQLLSKELQDIARIASKLGLQLETIYVGGGTPTAINEEQLTFLLQSIQNSFDTKKVKEYTVEAGRPDCTSYEKLEILKKFGVTRISINPQTMDNAILKKIGRKHSAEDIIRCYNDARKAGHTNINMDLIAGLPGESPAGFAHSLQQLLTLEPENITVHTLTLKRASNIVIDSENVSSLPGEMLQNAYPALLNSGYSPYYLYRQKSTVDNLENTGWTKAGSEGLYNIFIMEEAHTILAAGAGASTKLVAPCENKIERIFNFKYPVDYISSFEQVLDKKRGVSEFYARYLDS